MARKTCQIIRRGCDTWQVQIYVGRGSTLRDRVLAAPYGAALWKGLLSTGARQPIEVFPSNQAETKEYRRIRQACFG